MQRRVSEFNKLRGCHEKPMPISARILDIQSELGELSKEVLKNSKYGTTDFEVTEDFEMEFGDVLYSLFSLAQECNLDSEQALDKVLDKYKKRIENNKSMGSGK